MVDFVPVPNIWLVIIAVIPVIIWFLFRFNTFTEFIFGLIFIIGFTKGSLELLGISGTLSKVLIEMLILIIGTRLFVFASKDDIYLPAIWIIVGFMFTAIISTINSKTSFIQLILFFKEYLLIFLFLYIIINYKIKKSEIAFLTKLIIYLSISQIFANLIKVMIVKDILENYVGTISLLGGSITIIYALFTSAFCISAYLFSPKKKYIILLFGFLLFSLLGGKRATIFYIPLIYILAIIFYQRKFSLINSKIISKILMFMLATIFVFYATARMLPTLNPDNKIGGRFDINYILEYSNKYSKGEDTAINRIGRVEAPIYLMERIISTNVYNILFGFGSGHLVKSNFNEILKNTTQQEYSLFKYGVGYGARTGFLQILLQTGFVGVILYCMIFINLLIKLVKKRNKLAINPTFHLSAILFVIIVLIDFFTYSVSSLKIGAISMLYIWVLGLLFKRNLNGVL